MGDDAALDAAKSSLLGTPKKTAPVNSFEELDAAKKSLFGAPKNKTLASSDAEPKDAAKGALLGAPKAKKAPVPAPVPALDGKADTEPGSTTTRRQLLAMGDGIGLDEEEVDGIVEAFEGDADAYDKTAAMLRAQVCPN